MKITVGLQNAACFLTCLFDFIIRRLKDPLVSALLFNGCPLAAHSFSEVPHHGGVSMGKETSHGTLSRMGTLRMTFYTGLV